MRIRISLALVLGALAVTGSARSAPTKDQCLEANGQAQQLRVAGKLSEAREQLMVCLDPGCPAILRDDCGGRLEALNAAQPSIVFEAKAADGRDLSAVNVTMDGKPLTSNLTGEAIRLDPGAHDFTFETEGEKPITKQIILREGEVGRHELIVFGDTKPAVKLPILSVVAGEGDAIKVDSTSVAVSRWSGPLAAGPHRIEVSHEGKKPYSSTVDLTGDRSLDIKLEADKQGGLPLWAWIAGGVVVASGMTVGGYFLFKGSDEMKAGARPVGGLDSGTLSLRFGR